MSGSEADRFSTDEACADRLDASDPLRAYRDAFHLPRRSDGTPLIYFAGHSLGLMPKAARDTVEEVLSDWGALGVEGHFAGKRPWYRYHERLREPAARLVGAQVGEVVMMNSLTVNLHLMMVTFYRPTKTRHKILMEAAAFPSDTFAAASQLRVHGFDPDDGLLIARPRDGEHAIRTEDVEALLDRHGRDVALVLLGGVNYFTGQVFDMARITAAAKKNGCVVGLDLAHAAGNVELSLHDWGVDFACWCNYKYLNSGPGAVGGCFVHETHARNVDLPRLAGWWGNDPDTRFTARAQTNFHPVPGADGWQVSNPPILALAPLVASYDLFDRVGVAGLRDKTRRLNAYLRFQIDAAAPKGIEVITPGGDAGGCQLSMLVHDRPEALLDALKREGVVGDFRAPNIIRVAPVPLYNTFREVWTFSRILARHVERKES